MIYITGDVHGDVDFEKLMQLRSNNASLSDTLIILGDAGICWSPEFTRNIISLYRKLNITVIFLDGNHENFDMLESFPFLFCWESLANKNFRPTDFGGSELKPGQNAFTISPSKWIALTNAIGFKIKLGRGDAGTYAHKDIAFEFASWISAEFKVLLIREYQRLKEEENKRLDWAGKRQLSSLNYLLQTDAIKNHIIQVNLKPQQISYVYASEADVINVALFGITANEWKHVNPNLQGNIRDYANIIELTILSNLELLNSKLIEKNIDQAQRLVLLNKEANKEKSLFISYKPKLLQ